MMVFSMWRSEQWEISANVWIYFFFFLVSISLVLHNYLTILPFFFEIGLYYVAPTEI